MYRRLAARKVDSEADYDRYEGQAIVVDLAEIDGRGESFEGAKWLESKFRNRQPIGWDLEWPPDRTKDSNNPIALMQFADHETVLLIRTHRTERWLPNVVKQVLSSETCVKICVGWDGADKKKMKSSFELEPAGLLDLANLASQKGLRERGLKALAEHFGLKMKKETRVARSDWATLLLSKEQIAYAAEDAYFTYLLKDKLEALNDVEDESVNLAVEGQLALRPGWAEAGIVRRHDGLHCELCGQGPMNTHENVLSHLRGNNHEKKTKARQGFGPEGKHVLTEEEETNGIFAGDGSNGAEVGEFKCRLCEDVQLRNVQSIKDHLKSKKHQKALGLAPDAEVSSPSKDPFERLWNLPDYVELNEEHKELLCTLCSAKAATVSAMYQHLHGERHRKKAMSQKVEDVIWIKERNQLEYTTTGRPVRRKGSAAQAGAATQTTKTTTTETTKTTKTRKTVPATAKATSKETATPLPAGWAMSWDDASKSYYYWPVSDKSKTQWQHPAETPVPKTTKAPATPETPQKTETAPVEQSTAGKGDHAASMASTLNGKVDDEWEEHETDDGHKFYYNLKTKTSHWLRQHSEQPGDPGEPVDAGSSKKTATGTSNGYAQQADGKDSFPSCNGDSRGVPTNRLPPGWREVLEQKSGRVFYWDGEGQTSSWTRPVYYHQEWKRRLGPEGAYWILRGSNDHAPMSFWESDPAWSRRQDEEGNIYWSSQEHQVRFFEDEAASACSSTNTQGFVA